MPRLVPFVDRIRAAIRATGCPGPGVAFPVGAPLSRAAVGAQPPVGLVRKPAAPGAESTCEPILGPLPSAAVLGLVGLRIADAPDAGVGAFGGAGAIRGTPLIGGCFADPSPGRGLLRATSETSSQSIDLTAPSSTGMYYYGACVDAVAGESDTTNNCSSSVRVTVRSSETPGSGTPGSDT